MIQYVSPFRMLGIDISQNIDKQTLTLAKKKFLAEAELSENQSVMLNRQEMTKNDILNFFDNFEQNEESLDYHRMIAKAPALANFLEHRYFDRKETGFHQLGKNYDEEGFINFISPYYSDVYAELILDFLDNHKIVDLKALFRQAPLIMDYYDEDKMWDSVSTYIEDLTNLLFECASTIETAYLDNIPEFENYIDKDFMLCLNTLPEEQFSFYRNRYAIALQNLAVSLWNKGLSAGAKKVAIQSLYLDCDTSTKNALVTAKNHFNQNKAPNDSETEIPYQLILFVIFLALRACAN
jgi:hypothetical protein